jgi:glycine dehydrogenase subunit 1
MAAKNVPAGSVPFFVGAGAYRHHVPASVDHLIQRSEFLTSYTPYQPEIAQGTLQYLFEFQTQVANLTAMEVANASMYDGSTGTAEAVLMAHRLTRKRKAVLSGGLHPQYRAVVETVSGMAGDAVRALAADPTGTEAILESIDKDTSCVVVQSPSFYGNLIDLQPIAEKAHAVGALLIAVFTEVVSLGAIEPPGTQGADIVVGEGQSIGNPLTFGGPYVGLFATRQKYVRQMPGRLCGETVDAEDRRGFVLTLSTREQHIRRDKATSNICTNSGLCCLAFTIHMSLLGETGLTRLAALNHANAVKLAESLSEVSGVSVLNDSFFNEFTIRVPGDAAAVIEKLAAKGVLGGVPVSRIDPIHPELNDLIVVASTEINTDEDRAAYATALKEVL